MTLHDIMTELESLGNESTKKILLKHGLKEPLFGVKVEHLKVIQKKIKKDYRLSNELYFTNNADAMYLAGLIADDEQMTKEDLQAWVEKATSSYIGEYTVPWVAAGGRYGFESGMEWIDSKQEHIAAAGWATLSGLVSLKPDNELPLPVLKKLLGRIEKNIHSAKDRERYTMNGFVIAVGTYVKDFAKDANDTAVKIGPVIVVREGTACKVPDAIEHIRKATERTKGKKKKTVKC